MSMSDLRSRGIETNPNGSLLRSGQCDAPGKTIGIAPRRLSAEGP